MASYLFINNKTKQTKVVNSKDAVTAKRVYTNGTWSYVKAVPQQKVIKSSSKSNSKISEIWIKSCELVSQVQCLKQEAEDYDVRFARNRAYEMCDILAKMQSLLRELK